MSDLKFLLTTKEENILERDSLEIEKDQYFGGVFFTISNCYGDSCSVKFSLADCEKIAEELIKITRGPNDR